MMTRPSRSTPGTRRDAHCTAAPVWTILPSMPKVGWLPSCQANVVDKPWVDAIGPLMGVIKDEPVPRVALTRPGAKPPCPYSAGASFTYYKGLWNQLEEEMPGRKLSFYVDFLKRGRSAFAGLERTEGDALAPCTVCGYPTSSGVCGVCRIREAIKEGKE